MTPKLQLTAGLILAGLVSLTCFAQKDPSPTPMGAEKDFHDFTKIQIENFDEEKLGRIKDLAIDLVNGSIVAVLVMTDSSLGEKSKIIAVPPTMLIADAGHQVYRIHATTESFQSAPGIDLSKWNDATRAETMAATYRHFGQQPYFLQQGAASSPAAAGRPRVALGYVERSFKIMDLPVANHEGTKFGKVWSLAMDIPKGRIVNVVILAPGNFQTKTIVPATALDFNAARNGLLLDLSKQEFAIEPRYVFTEAAFGQDSSYKRESYKGPYTNVALEQGDSYRDVQMTLKISRDIRAAKISRRNVDIGTMDSRVTLRGWVDTAEDKRRIGEVAVAASRLEAVDNQIVIGKPGARN